MGGDDDGRRGLGGGCLRQDSAGDGVNDDERQDGKRCEDGERADHQDRPPREPARDRVIVLIGLPDGMTGVPAS